MSYKTETETLYTLLKGEGLYQFQGELHDDYAILKAGELVGVDASTGKIKPASAYTTVAAFLAEFCGVAAQEKPKKVATDETTYDRKIGIFPEAPVEYYLSSASALKPFQMLTPVLDTVPNPDEVKRDTLTTTADPTLAVGYVRQAYPLATDLKTTTTRVLAWIKGRKACSYVFADT